MKPEELRFEILKLCEAFGAAAQSGNLLVINVISELVKTRIKELIPDNALNKTK